MSYCVVHNLNDTVGRGCIECLRDRLVAREQELANTREQVSRGQDAVEFLNRRLAIVNAEVKRVANERETELAELRERRAANYDSLEWRAARQRHIDAPGECRTISLTSCQCGYLQSEWARREP